MTKLSYGSFLIIVVLSVGGGFVYGAESIPEELTFSVPCAAVNHLQETDIMPVDLFSKFDRAGAVRFIEVFSKLHEPGQREELIKRIHENKFCKSLLENHQSKFSKLLVDLSYDELSEEGRDVIFSTLDFLFDNGLINESQEVTVINEVLGIFCATHKDNDLKTKLLGAINGPFFKGKLSQNKHHILRQIFGYDIESSEQSLCPKDKPRKRTKYMPANLSEALVCPIHRRVNYFTYYFKSYSSEVNAVFGDLSNYAPYLEKMIDPESDFAERVTLLENIVVTSTAELDSILEVINKLLKKTNK